MGTWIRNEHLEVLAEPGVLEKEFIFGYGVCIAEETCILGAFDYHCDIIVSSGLVYTATGITWARLREGRLTRGWENALCGPPTL